MPPKVLTTLISRVCCSTTRYRTTRLGVLPTQDKRESLARRQLECAQLSAFRGFAVLLLALRRSTRMLRILLRSSHLDGGTNTNRDFAANWSCVSLHGFAHI